MEPINIVIGGQYGSEGKGAFIAWLTDPARCGPVTAIRTGGPNAGHSMKYGGHVFKMQHVPCAWHNPNALLLLGPGSVIDPASLLMEIADVEKALGHTLDNFAIHPAAAIITGDDVRTEQNTSAYVRDIGSTNHGVGAATAARVMRHGRIARDCPELRQYVTSEDWYDAAINNFTNRPILVETTQGFMLSLTRSGLYPYATSRDITPAQALNDAGIPSQLPHRATMVMRTYPIRVGGNSGPLPHEIAWADLQRRIPHLVDPERTTVTNKVRRIAYWDAEAAGKASRAILPAAVVLTFFDYLFPGLHESDTIPAHVRQAIGDFEIDVGAPIKWVSTGFQNVVEL